MTALAASHNVMRASWRPLLTAVVLIGLAEAAKRANLLPVFVPSPSEVVMEIWNAPRLVTENLAPTAWKATMGYFIAAAIAMAAGSIAVSVRAVYGPIYNFGVALARRGKRVACIDADIGLRNLDVVLGLENRIVYDIVDVVEGRARLRQALIRDKRLPDLQMLPAAQTRDKTAVNPQQMIKLADDLRAEMDFILIDSPAGIEHGFKNAIAPAMITAHALTRFSRESESTSHGHTR